VKATYQSERSTRPSNTRAMSEKPVFGRLAHHLTERTPSDERKARIQAVGSSPSMVGLQRGAPDEAERQNAR
jgi:hypothetical protein